MHSALRYLKVLWRGKQKAIFTRHSLVKALQTIMMPVNAICSKHCLDKNYMGNRNPPAASHLFLLKCRLPCLLTGKKGSVQKKFSLIQQQGWDFSCLDTAATWGHLQLGMGNCKAQGPGGDSMPQWRGLDGLWRDICCNERQNIIEVNECRMGLKFFWDERRRKMSPKLSNEIQPNFSKQFPESEAGPIA